MSSSSETLPATWYRNCRNVACYVSCCRRFKKRTTTNANSQIHTKLPLQRHHSSGRIGHAALSRDPCSLQEPAADLRQADDLLSAIHADAGGDTGHSADLHAGRRAAVPAVSGGWFALRPLLSIYGSAA